MRPSQTHLTEFGCTRDVGEWRLATDEPGFYSLRRYWRTEEYVLVAHQPSDHFSVYDVETWESGILGDSKEPVVEDHDLDDAIEAAERWMLRHRDGRVES